MRDTYIPLSDEHSVYVPVIRLTALWAKQFPCLQPSYPIQHKNDSYTCSLQTDDNGSSLSGEEENVGYLDDMQWDDI